MLNYLKERKKYLFKKKDLLQKFFLLQIFIFRIETSTKKSFITVLLLPSTHISSKLSLKKLKIGGMEQLDNLIYDTISTLRSNKKQPNENAIYSLISKLESLSKDQLEERLNCLVKEEKLKHKPHNGKNSYCLETNRTNLFSSIEKPIHQGSQTTPTETAESTLPCNEIPLPPESITTPMLNNLQRFTNENALLKDQIQNLAAEIEAVKMLMKEQLFHLKKTQKDKSNEEEQ